MKIFILEDDPNRMAGFEAALYGSEIHHGFTVDEAKAAWQPPYDVICLDHDLGGEIYVPSEDENTGYQFALWLAKQQIASSTLIVIHSWNIDGARKMFEALMDVPCRIVRQTFCGKMLKDLRTYVMGMPVEQQVEEAVR